ncbi:SNF2 family N-terminal domain-containing protein [Phellopilus nigrolimitatus]|nr:SNF2 family N-terminal domain-containing protein [Phellopilus nigrolimitatus]
MTTCLQDPLGYALRATLATVVKSSALALGLYRSFLPTRPRRPTRGFRTGSWTQDQAVHVGALTLQHRVVHRPARAFAWTQWLPTMCGTRAAALCCRPNEWNLADEMGLGKTIQTISLLAHLACDQGIWGPHPIIVPTSVLLNWEMEFKKFLPGFKILSYHGTTKRRKELRQGWNTKHAFNVCVTSYTLASRDQHIFKRKAWYYMILDEAHMIKNFKSQRWNIFLMFRSFRRLLLTGTPLQNNLTELWALLQFLMSGTTFANLKDFGEWFATPEKTNTLLMSFTCPLEKAIEQGNVQDQEVQIQVTKLHTVLRPYLLRRLKRDVEKELPSKYDHLVLCRLSKRQRFLYDEFMSESDTSAIAAFDIKELLDDDRFSHVNLDVLGLQFTRLCNTSSVAARETRSLEEILAAEVIAAYPGEPPPRDTRTIEGYRKYRRYQLRAATYARFSQMVYLNRLRCDQIPIYGLETIEIARRLCNPLTSACEAELLSSDEDAANIIDKFAFATPAVVARDLPSIVLRGLPEDALQHCSPVFDSVLHRASVKLQTAFPDVSLLQYDCGKLQELAHLLRERKSGIFTQTTKILDILEMFLNFHGYLYLRLDGATKIEDRQYITEWFNVDKRIFAFIALSRSGGV